MVDIIFRTIACPNCNGNKQTAIFKGNRYGLYCSDCGRFIKWADKGQTAVIKARIAYINEHKQEYK